MSIDISRYTRKSLTTHWSISAIECLKRGCVCDGCIYNEILNGQFDPTNSDINPKCQMKRIVLWLVRRLGNPLEDRNQIED